MKVPPTVDTRFFLAHFLAETAAAKDKTRRKAEELQRQRAFVPTIVLHEVYKFEYETAGAEVAVLRIDSITRSNFRIVDLDTPIALSAARMRCHHRGLPTADSIIAATALELKSTSVITDDPHFAEIKGITVEWV